LSPDNRKPVKPLYNIFSDIPPRYDRINFIFTWGMDRKWRRKTARECLANNPQRVLDLGCGTGDLSLEIAAKAKSPLEVTGLDYSQPMLDLAAVKAKERGLTVKYIEGIAADLSFPDKYFDTVGIAFAFRNLTYKNPHAAKHISEVLRILRPGGRFVIVESSQPENGFIRAADHFYVKHFAYPLGWWISGNRGAYKYLSFSAAHYYNPGELKDLLLKAGFSEVSFQRLFLGAVALHIAVK